MFSLLKVLITNCASGDFCLSDMQFSVVSTATSIHVGLDVDWITFIWVCWNWKNTNKTEMNDCIPCRHPLLYCISAVSHSTTACFRLSFEVNIFFYCLNTDVIFKKSIFITLSVSQSRLSLSLHTIQTMAWSDSFQSLYEWYFHDAECIFLIIIYNETAFHLSCLRPERWGT